MTFDDGRADRLLLPLTLPPALAADLGAVSVSHVIAELGWVWVSVSDLQKRWRWGSMLDSMLPWELN